MNMLVAIVYLAILNLACSAPSMDFSLKKETNIYPFPFETFKPPQIVNPRQQSGSLHIQNEASLEKTTKDLLSLIVNLQRLQKSRNVQLPIQPHLTARYSITQQYSTLPDKDSDFRSKVQKCGLDFLKRFLDLSKFGLQIFGENTLSDLSITGLYNILSKFIMKPDVSVYKDYVKLGYNWLKKFISGKNAQPKIQNSEYILNILQIFFPLVEDAFKKFIEDDDDLIFGLNFIDAARWFFMFSCKDDISSLPNSLHHVLQNMFPSEYDYIRNITTIFLSDIFMPELYEQKCNGKSNKDNFFFLKKINNFFVKVLTPIFFKDPYSHKIMNEFLIKSNTKENIKRDFYNHVIEVSHLLKGNFGKKIIEEWKKLHDPFHFRDCVVDTFDEDTVYKLLSNLESNFKYNQP